MKEKISEGSRRWLAAETGRRIRKLLQSPPPKDESLASAAGRFFCETLDEHYTFLYPNEDPLALCCGRILLSFHPAETSVIHLHLNINAAALYAYDTEKKNWNLQMLHASRCGSEPSGAWTDNETLHFSTTDGFTGEIPLQMICTVRRWHEGCAFTTWYHPYLLLNVGFDEVKQVLSDRLLWCSERTGINPGQVSSAESMHVIASSGACIDLTQSEWKQYCLYVKRMLREKAYAAV